jgi:alpha-galactosidase
MYKIIIVALTSILSNTVDAQKLQSLSLPSAKFSKGDNTEWASPKFNDSQWKNISTTANWESQSYIGYDGFAWYRIHVTIPSALKQKSFLKDSIRIDLGKIDDAAEVFLNGELVAKSGSFPADANGYVSAYYQPIEFHVATNAAFLHWDKDNIISIRVYDGGGNGGMYGPISFINMMDIIDEVSLQTDEEPFVFSEDNKVSKSFSINNHSGEQIDGTLSVKALQQGTGKELYQNKQAVQLAAHSSEKMKVAFASREAVTLFYTFTEDKTKKTIREKNVVPYILTPKESPEPKINGAKVFGVRPGSPFLFRIPATGESPKTFSVKDIPDGLSIDENTGIITGVLKNRGEYKMEFIVKNKLGEAKRSFTIKAGDLLALTPPMGWNSWNCWGLSVSDAKVKSSVDALIDKGLMNHGWTYINIDDGWEAAKRSASGEIISNEKFPDMKAFTKYLHDRGLKSGIYSSPGNQTCGGYLGSLDHEMQDATSYANWGIDYLKYDLCSYEDKLSKNATLEEYQKPYKLMEQALKSQSRDIVYSLCEYGLKDVWKWGAEVNGNLWRTTGDITDSWESLYGIGFRQDVPAPYAKPGRWNDPDMLTIGKVGWGDHLHETHLTPDEQYTHISLWSLLSAPLLLGCDLSGLDDFTLNLITNDEVIAIDQDPLGKAAHKAFENKNYQVWVKDLEDGNKAIGIFNVSDHYSTIKINLATVSGSGKSFDVRDLWRQKDLGVFNSEFTTNVQSHSVTFIKIKMR